MSQEAQAIILAAGPGMRMTSLTSKHPKCLLPVGTLPMIYYPLVKLEEMGFSEVTVVVSKEHKRDIEQVADQYDLKIRLDIATVTTGNDPGTMDSLRDVANQIKKSVNEVLILSCDLITDISLLPVYLRHIEKDAALTVLLGDEERQILPTEPSPPGPKTKSSINDDIICTEEGTDRLVYSVVGGDYDEILTISGLMKNTFKNPINISSKCLDAHMYIMKRWVLNYILNEQSPCSNMGSFKAEIIPHIISRQVVKDDSPSGINSFMEIDEDLELIKQLNISVIPSKFHNLAGPPQVECYCYRHTGVIVRVNTIKSYWQVNNQIHTLFKDLCPSSSWSLKQSQIQSKAQVSDDTVVGRSAIISEKTNITKSVIGNHCKISPLCRISNSILGPYVNVADGCVIENCLIFCSIEKKCTLKNCIVTDETKIVENMTVTNETLEASQDFTA